MELEKIYGRSMAEDKGRLSSKAAVSEARAVFEHGTGCQSASISWHLQQSFRYYFLLIFWKKSSTCVHRGSLHYTILATVGGSKAATTPLGSGALRHQHHDVGFFCSIYPLLHCLK